MSEPTPDGMSDPGDVIDADIIDAEVLGETPPPDPGPDPEPGTELEAMPGWELASNGEYVWISSVTEIPDPADEPDTANVTTVPDAVRGGGNGNITDRPGGKGFTGKAKRRRGAGGTGGGGNHFSLISFANLLSGWRLPFSGPIASDNALFKGRTGSGHTGVAVNPSRSSRSGAGRVAGRASRRKW